jgi:hypothetical protein
METLTYSNPRVRAVIENWPIGGSKRGTATFAIEYRKGKGERATRTTTGAAKVLTYARQSRIVDGNDGRTYILNLTEYGHISVMCGDMQFQKETLFPDNARYAEVRALIHDEAN